MKMSKNLIFLLGFILISRCVHLNEAKKAYDAEDYSTTVTLCKQAIAKDSTDTAAYILLAKSYRALDSLDAALKMVKNAEKFGALIQEVIREKCLIYLDMGNKYLSDDNVRMALQNYKSVESLCPENIKALLRIADIYHDLGRLDDARNRYEKITFLQSDSSLVSDKLEDIVNRTNESAVLVEQGVTAYQKKHYITAKTKLEEALRLKSDDKNAQYHLHMAEGHILFKKGSQANLWDAIEAFGKATVIQNDIAEPHYWLARSYEKKDDDEFVNAIDEYEIALKLDPQGARAKSIQKKIIELKKRKERLDKFWGKKS